MILTIKIAAGTVKEDTAILPLIIVDQIMEIMIIMTVMTVMVIKNNAKNVVNVMNTASVR